jgi:hypothetical protein
MFLLATALATQVSWHTAECPLDAGPVRVFEKLSANSHGGWDSDGAFYSTEGQWREYALATCPDNLYTVYNTDILSGLTPEQETEVRKKLKQVQRATDPDALEIWDRYLIAAQVYAARGAGPDQLFQLYLEASWTARDAAVGVYLGLEGPEAARTLLNEGRAELEKDLDPGTRKVLLHNLARVAHRGGWPVERDHYLEQFEAVGALTDTETEVLATFRHANVVEARLQRLAIEQADAALLLESLSPKDKARIRYLRADLLRRLGEIEEARTELDAVQKDPALEDRWIGSARFLEGTIPTYR